MENATCLVTGANGYLGRRMTAMLAANEWTVRGMVRNPAQGSRDIPFHLGKAMDARPLTGATALIHCAYDLKAVGRESIWSANVRGSQQLFAAAREAGISKLVFISTISAFPGCRSLYGQSKLEIEEIARQHGALIIRPGLIWAKEDGGIFGKLRAQVEKSKIIPLIGDGSQIQYLVHEEDLCRLVFQYCKGLISLPSSPVTLAHRQPWTFRSILEALAAAKGKRPFFIPTPWRLMWAGFRLGEFLHLGLPFRSDSIVSLVHQNPNPDFSPADGLGVDCRPFRP